jgi:hypothetical protein
VVRGQRFARMEFYLAEADARRSMELAGPG